MTRFGASRFPVVRRLRVLLFAWQGRRQARRRIRQGDMWLPGLRRPGRSIPRVTIADVREAHGIFSRSLGLMGRFRIGPRKLWIPACNSVHTWFLLVPIDIVFLDSLGVVVKVFSRVRPWRFIHGGPACSSVLEGEAGFASASGLEPGVMVEWGGGGAMSDEG